MQGLFLLRRQRTEAESRRGMSAIVRCYGREASTCRENSVVVTIPFERIRAVDRGSIKLEGKISNKVSIKKGAFTEAVDALDRKYLQ